MGTPTTRLVSERWNISSMMAACSLAGYGVRFRTPNDVTATHDRDFANLLDEFFVKEHKFQRECLMVRRLHSAPRMRGC